MAIGGSCRAQGHRPVVRALTADSDPPSRASEAPTRQPAPPEALHQVRSWSSVRWFETTEIALVADLPRRVGVPIEIVDPRSSSIDSWVPAV